MIPVNQQENPWLNSPVPPSQGDCDQQTSEYALYSEVPGLSLFKVPDLVLALGDGGWNCPTSPLAPSSCSLQVAATEGYKPTMFNRLLAYALENAKANGNDHSLESEALFRTILWPHRDPDQKDLAHPFWEAMRAMDEYVFAGWRSKAQRIAVVYLCSQLLKVR